MKKQKWATLLDVVGASKGMYTGYWGLRGGSLIYLMQGVRKFLCHREGEHLAKVWEAELLVWGKGELQACLGSRLAREFKN